MANFARANGQASEEAFLGGYRARPTTANSRSIQRDEDQYQLINVFQPQYEIKSSQISTKLRTLTSSGSEHNVVKAQHSTADRSGQAAGAMYFKDSSR
ncbi:hypothetical protein VTL71DRAFT_3263, partial [Oculimacula yallundae]